MLARYAPESRIGRQEGGYDALAKLSSNENPYGPSPAAMKAMEAAWKYSNRYGYPTATCRKSSPTTWACLGTTCF